jgi:prepilin-type processing-associated H-X9-DG protein
MMVVIAVIVVLAGLLLPGLSAARENARTTQCQSNLMQMSKAWMMYSDVHNGLMMPVTTYVTGNPANAPPPNLQYYWFGQVLVPQSSTNPGTLDVNQGFLASYLEGNPQMYLCPDFTVSMVQNNLRYNRLTSGYAYNYKYLGPGPTITYDASFNATYNPNLPTSFSYAALKSTSTTVVFADSVLAGNVGYPPVPPYYLQENWYLSTPQDLYPTAHYRHRGNVCVVGWADGHSERRGWVTPVSGTLSSYPTQETFALQNYIGYIGIDESFYNGQIIPVPIQ